ncbi:MAG: T9SS type A sorting domain-containing protein [Bacteroidota bacterium]|nr:T9SS type A sorting domain-containing protein [Bacteroidota bacterium]
MRTYLIILVVITFSNNIFAQWKLKRANNLPKFSNFCPIIIDTSSMFLFSRYGGTKIFKSKDMGNTWDSTITPIPLSIYQVQNIFNSESAFIRIDKGDSVSILKTINSFVSYSKIFQYTAHNIYDTSFVKIDSTVYSDTVIYKKDIVKTLIGVSKLESIKFLNSTTGIAVISTGEIFLTNDGGDAWTSRNIFQNKKFISNVEISALSENIFRISYALNSQIFYIKSFDKGKTWSIPYVVNCGVCSSYNIKNITFVNSLIGYSLGDGNNMDYNIYKTDNGGANFYVIGNHGVHYRDSKSIVMLDCNIGYIISQGGQGYYNLPYNLKITMDGGVTWKSQFINFSDFNATMTGNLMLTGFYMSDSFKGIAYFINDLSNNYSIPFQSYVLNTQNGGDKNKKTLGMECINITKTMSTDTSMSDTLLNNTIKYIDSQHVSIYPNPFYNSIIIKSNSIILSIEIISNLQNTLKFEFELPGKEIALNFENLQTGFYILKINLLNGVLYKKIIKN